MVNKKLTPKQLQTKAQSLLRGIDNSAANIAGHYKKINTAIPELSQTLTALSNAEHTNKPVTTKKIVSPSTKTFKKNTKNTKKANTIKAKAKKSPAKVDCKSTNPSRPSLRDATKELLKGNKKMTRADLYKTVTGKYGYWSRQSLYKVVTDENEFSMDEMGNVSLKTNKTNNKNVETFAEHAKNLPVSKAT